MSEAICEFVDSRGVALRVDRPGGVLRGVKLIGLASQNGRRYRPEALARAVGLYEGAKVNVNHPQDGALSPRDYRDRLGVIRQVEFRPAEGLFGNLHFNPKHAVAEQLAWDAEHNPRNVGFSHNVLARLSRDEAGAVVDEITHVQSVDLVADPAATQGLFENASGQCAAGGGKGNCSNEEVVSAIEAAEARARLAERRALVAELFVVEGMPTGGGRSTIRETVGPAFYDALLEAVDDESARALVMEQIGARRRQAPSAGGSTGPRSTEQGSALGKSGAGCRTMRDFVQAVRGRR